MNHTSNVNLYRLTLYSGVIKTLLTLLVGIFSVPYTLGYFGAEKYGVWNVISSFIVFLSMTNLGLNSAATILINKNPNYLIKIQILKKSFRILCVVIPIVYFLFFSLIYYYPWWFDIINSPKSIEHEAKVAALVMFIFSILNIPFSLVVSALNGFQKNYIENLFGIFNIILSIGSLVYVVEFGKDLVYYAYISSITLLILNIIKVCYFKIFIYKYCSVDNVEILQDAPESSYKVILLTGYRCMLGAVASMFVLNTDNIVIAKFIGIKFVTEFSVTFKLYSTVFTLIYLFNSSIVPLIGKNIHNDKYISKIYNNTLYTVSIIGGLLWLGTVSIGKLLIFNWVGIDGYAGVFVLIFLGAYSYVFSIVNLNYIMINSLNLLKGVVFITWFEGLLNLTLSVYLGKKFGLGGVAAGTFLGTFVSPFFLFSYILKKRTSHNIFQDNLFIGKHFLFSLLPTIYIGYLINVYQNDFLTTFILTSFLCFLYLSLSYFCLPIRYRLLFRRKLKNSVISILV
jgi:O-antigen/teichoic acid export membrane protein